ncbi:hypothetical protein [Streptomyces sp. NPDC093225]|uniref:hypothetical protein n=1 Tax=Streptomyces sp. NPDC093225 TaxID=3366034 RepID=UPI0038098FF3
MPGRGWGSVFRRLAAGAAAIALFLEAVGLVVVHLVLGTAVDRQSMSIAGMDPDLMSGATYGMGALMGAFMALCGLLLLVTAVRDRAPGRVARILLVVCAVTDAVLGALVVGMVGWPAFALMMLILGLVVLTLVAYGKRDADGAAGTPPAPEPGAPEGGAPEAGVAPA